MGIWSELYNFVDMGKLESFFKRFISFMGEPVAAFPLLFVTAIVCCSSAVIVSTVCGGERHLRFLIYGFFQGCAWGWLFCLICRRHKIFRYLAAALMLLALLIETVHYILFDHVVDYDSFRLLLNTDPVEVKGFFRQFFSKGVIVLVVVGLIAVVGLPIAINRADERLRRKLSHFTKGLGVFMTVSIVVGLFGIAKMLTVLFQRDYNQIVVWQTQGSDNPELVNMVRALYSDPLLKGIVIWRTVESEHSNIEAWSRLQYSLAERDDVAFDGREKTDSLNIVVVIGESFIRSHSSLYGYHLPVNPRLEEELDRGALTVFTDAISPANFTVLSISNLLSLNSVSRDEKWWEAAGWHILFAKAGWRVNVFTNQYVPGKEGDLEKVFFHPLLSGANGGSRNTFNRRYDGEFLTDISAQLRGRDESAHELTIWQLRGQHFPPSMQLPESSRHPFSIDDVPADKSWLTPERRQVVADYANATLYNDSILGSIIDLYRSRPTLLVYFSDHGEEMWDTAPFGNRNRQRPEDREWMRRQHDIPLVIWMSDIFQERYPQLADAVRDASALPMTTDHIGHTLLNISGIKTPYYRRELDVLSPDYKPQKRKTAQGYPYD